MNIERMKNISSKCALIAMYVISRMIRFIDLNYSCILGTFPVRFTRDDLLDCCILLFSQEYPKHKMYIEYISSVSFVSDVTTKKL